MGRLILSKRRPVRGFRHSHLTASRHTMQSVLRGQVMICWSKSLSLCLQQPRGTNRVDRICAGGPLSHDEAETFRKRLLGKERPQWFAFLRHPGTPPTDNLAERAIRPIVLRSKTRFVTRSKEGSTNLAVLTSLLRTARLQLRPPLDFLRTVLTHDLPAAFQFLYHNST